jgi:putative ABC transport system permease protein
MIGLALVTFVATLGAGMRGAFADSLGDQIRAGHIVSAGGSADAGVFPVAAERALARTPGVTVASGVRSEKARAFGETTGVMGVDPATIARVYRFDLERGAGLAGLRTGAMVPEDYAEDHHLAPGSRLTLQTPSGVRRTLPVTARDQKDLDKTLTLVYVLLALSVIVSLFGMVNTMILSVFERTRELGMLRAIGMSRRQARRMIRQESVITALIGAALGLPLGVFLAAIVTRAMSDLGVGFRLPVSSLVAFTALAAVAGIVAALPPARRASRLDVLHALQYE